MADLAEASEIQARASWVPRAVIALGQALLSLSFSALPVTRGGLVENFGAAPTQVATAIVVNALFVSGFILLGARLDFQAASRSVAPLPGAK